MMLPVAHCRNNREYAMGDSHDRTETVRLNVHFTNEAPDQQLPTVFKELAKLFKQGERIMAALDALTAAVAKNTEVDTSAIALLQGLKAKLDEAIASGDPAAVQRLSDDLAASTSALADAVAANTPAAP